MRPAAAVKGVAMAADSERARPPGWQLKRDCATIPIMDNATISEQTRTLIEATVREHLVGYDVAPCMIEIVDDEPGTVGISIGICYFSAGPPVHPRATLALLSALRGKLVADGDWRMPFVEHYFDKDQKFEGLRRAC